MRSCTSTNIHQAVGSEEYYFPVEESIRMCKKAGFECIDINLHSAAEHSGPLSEDNHWRQWTENVRAIAENEQIPVPYCHSFFYVWENRTEEAEKLTQRSIEAAGILGAKWVVVHPYSARNDAWYSRRKSIDDNRKYMEGYAGIASKYNMGIAIENMVESPVDRRFGSCAEDLLELNDILNDSIFQICWDFGHGERSNCDTASSLRMIGTALKCVHVHDYTLKHIGCDHTLPYFGLTDWNSVMPVMSEIGYDGDWNFECQNYTKNLPPQLRETALKLACETNKNMIKLAMET